MSSDFDNRLPLRLALGGLGAWLISESILMLAARSILRIWVDSRRNQFVLPYDGQLLLLGALLAIAAGAVCIAFYFRPGNQEAAAEAHIWLAANVLFGAAGAGIIASGIGQAWLHVARLAIPGGLAHPRSLVLVSFAAAALGAALAWSAVQKRGPGRY